MNSIELQNILSCVKNIQVCASNEIKKTSYPIKIIVNSQRREDGKGIHWISFKIDKKRGKIVCWYFDSLAATNYFMMPDIKQFIVKNCDEIIYNGRMVQSLSSAFCGLHCSFFILAMEKNNNYLNFLKTYTSNVNKNDSLVAKLFHAWSTKRGKIIMQSGARIQSCKEIIKGAATLTNAQSE